MRFLLLTSLLAATFVCSCALPVRDEAEHSDESLLHDAKGNNYEQLVSELQEAPEVQDEFRSSSSGSDNGDGSDSSDSSERRQNSNLRAEVEDSESSDDQSKRTVLFRSSSLYDASFIASKGNEYDVEADVRSNERTVRHVPEKKPSTASSSEEDEEDAYSVLRESKVNLKPGLREKRSVSADSSGSSEEEKPHKHDELLVKRNAPVAKQSSEESGEDKDKKDNKADDSSSEEHGDKKKQESAARRRKRQTEYTNSVEVKSAEQEPEQEAEDILSQEMAEDVQKADNVQLEIDTSDELKSEQSKTVDDLQENALNSVEDYVQGCGVNEPDSNEANETTYLTDKR